MPDSERQGYISVIAILRTVLILGVTIVHLISAFITPDPVLRLVQGLLAVLVVVLSLPSIAGSTKYVAWAVFIGGAGLLFYAGAPGEAWLTGFEANLDLIVLIVFVPLLGMAIERGGYLDALRYLYSRFVRNGSRLYLYNSFLAFGLGMILNLGAPAVAYALNPLGQVTEDTQRLLTTSIARGFICAILLSPNFAAVGLVLRSLDLSWLGLAKVGVIVAVIMLVIGYLIELPRGSKIMVVTSLEEGPLPTSTSSMAKLVELVFFIIFSLVAVVIVQLVTRWSILTVVPVVAAILSFFWILYTTRSISIYTRSLLDFIKVRVGNMCNEITLFIGAGFLAVAIETSGLGDYLPVFITQLAGNSSALASFVIVSLVTLASIIGVHPIASVTVLLTVLDPQSIGLTPLFMGLTLLTGWALGVIISPFSADNLIVASLAGVSLCLVK